MPTERNFRELLEDLDEAQGTEIVRELESLKDTIYLLNQNYSEVHELGDWFHNQGLKIQPMKHRGMLVEFQKDFLRHLHNYVSSVYSLIRHTQRINNKYASDEFKQQYTSELQSRDLTGRGEFLKQLRHYAQKRKLPPIEVDLLHEDEGVRFAILIQKEDMMDWDEWNSNAREYLTTREEQIDILLEVVRYHERVGGFYEWYYEAIQDHLSDEMSDREQTIQEMQERHSKLFGDL